MIIDFPHSRRKHCETGSIKNLLQFYGWEISEPMIFGIGSGLFFLHFPWMKIHNIDSILFRVKPVKIFDRFTKRLGIECHQETFKDPVQSMKKLDEMLEQGIPTGLVVGLAHLPYLNAVGIKNQFNGHHIIIVGKEEDTYYVSDPDMALPNELSTISADDLRIARYPLGAMAPKGNLFYIKSLPEIPDLRPSIIAGIKETCYNMLEIPFPFFGTKGIRYFSRRISKWETKKGHDDTVKSFIWYLQLIEDAGTGGSAFRYIYADFLQESAKLFQDEKLLSLSDEMRLAGDIWRKFSVEVLRYTKGDADLEHMKTLSEIMVEASRQEEKVFKELKVWAKKKKI